MISGTLAAGKKRAEGRFTETFQFYTVTRTTVPDQIDPVETENVLWTGFGRWQNVNAIDRDEVTGEQIVTKSRCEVHVAVGSHAGEPGEFVRCTASTVDPDLVGLVVIVRGRPSRGQVTAWRHPVEEVVSG